MGEASYGVNLTGNFASEAGIIANAAREIRRQTQTLTPAFRAAATAEGRLERETRQLGNAARTTAPALRSVGTSTGSLRANVGQFLSGLTGMQAGLAGVALAAAMMARKVIDAFGRMALAAGKALAKAVGFGEAMAFSLSKFLGSTRAGQVEMGKLLDQSDQLGIAFQEASGTFKGMVSAGMTADAAREMVAFRADLLSVANTERDMQRVGEAFVQLEKAVATGRLEMDGFITILSGLPGVTETTIFEKLGPMMGKTVAELKKMDKTKIPIDKFLAAIKAAFLESTKASELGTLAIEKQLSTVGGAFEALKNIASNALIRIGQEIGPELKETLLPIFKDLMAYLKGDEGKKAIGDIAAALKSLLKISVAFGEGASAGFQAMLPFIKSIGKALGMASEDGGEMIDTFRLIGKVIGATAGWCIAFVGTVAWAARMAVKQFQWLKDQVTSIWSTLSGIFEGKGPIGILGALITEFSAIGQLVGLVAAFGPQIASAIGGWVSSTVGAVAEWAAGLWASISGLATQALAAASGIGSGIIDGLIAGIKAGLAGVVSAITGVIQAAISAGDKLLEMGSPSKLWHRKGKFSMKGYEEGVSEGAAGIRQATSSALSPPAVGGGLGGVTHNNFNQSIPVNISVPGAGEPEEVAAAVERRLRSRLGSVFEQLTIQYGF